jgi:5-hydroxyisourate hydrolase-like protein (transthyretin family)
MVQTRTVTGNVSDSGTGAPIASVSVTVSYTTYNESKVQLAQTTTDGNGNFSFSGVTFDSEPYIFDFVKSGYQNLEVSVTLNPGPNTVSEVMTSNMATFRGYVTNSSGTGISGVLITLVLTNTYTVTTAADGSFTISVPPGSYTVTFTKTGYQTVTL